MKKTKGITVIVQFDTAILFNVEAAKMDTHRSKLMALVLERVAADAELFTKLTALNYEKSN